MSSSRSRSHVVKMYPDEHESLKALASSAGVSLSEAFRRGAEQYLETLNGERTYRTRSGRILTEADIEALSAEAERGYDVEAILARRGGDDSDDELLTELKSLAGRIDRRIRRGS